MYRWWDLGNKLISLKNIKEKRIIALMINKLNMTIVKERIKCDYL